MKKLLIFIAALAMVATFAMTAAAAEWNFYGSARVATFWFDQDFATGVLNGAGDNDDSGLSAWGLQSNARIGANVKVSDTLSGHFEYGRGPNLRLLYGAWDFGAGTLTIGQMYTPMDFLISNQVFGNDNDLQGFGALYTGRRQGIKVQFGDFRLALLTPSTSSLSLAAGTFDIDTTIPAIEASYHLAFGPAYIDFAGLYNTYEIDTLAKNFDVDSFVLSVGAGANFGMFYIKSTAWIGENVGTTNFLGATAVADDPAIAGTKLLDNDAYGLVLVLGAKINDIITVEGGIGYTEAEVDRSGYKEDDALGYYVNATIHLAPGVFIVPEIGISDFKDSGAAPGALQIDEGSIVYYGLKWQINF